MSIPHHLRPSSPERRKEARRRQRYIWASAGVLFGALTFAASVALDAHHSEEPVPAARVLFLAALWALAGAGYGFFMWFALGRKADPLPRGGTFATRREAARAVRRRQPTGDPGVDGFARTLAENTLRVSPWATMYLPTAMFVFGFGVNVSSVTTHLIRPDREGPVPWINLFGAVLFFVLLVVLAPSVSRVRRNSHAYLGALEQAEQERPAPGAGR
ncbi:hypothetical protein SUDANB121_03037 [Nocardiopsis dassonvillei]|uniref:hypothetical protein n=1 Tax=Nocardiopsis dassonvillei TaxID=2014 RepID=UPI003F570E5F